MAERVHPPLSSLDDVQEQRYVDRSGWPRGEWDDEPDRVEWRDAAGVPVLPCLIVRGPSGALCGYVGVPPGHPWHGKDFDAVQAADGDSPDVHGGLTYAAACQPRGNICHAPLPGESDEVWWLGFDCNHAFDVAPKNSREPGLGHLGEAYRPISYVRNVVARLAEQAREAAK